MIFFAGVDAQKLGRLGMVRARRASPDLAGTFESVSGVIRMRPRRGWLLRDVPHRHAVLSPQVLVVFDLLSAQGSFLKPHAHTVAAAEQVTVLRTCWSGESLFSARLRCATGYAVGNRRGRFATTSRNPAIESRLNARR